MGDRWRGVCLLCASCFWASHVSSAQLVTQQVKGIVGESLTFPMEIPNLQPDTELNWRYGPVDPDSPIARIQSGTIKVFEGRFKARLQLDNMSSSLRINGLQTADSGIYQVEEIGGNRFKKRFQLSVYNPVPEPQVLQIHSGEALVNRSCTLLCFVGNASEVNVSWMRDGKPLNTTELEISQEMQGGDVTYTCVASNPASNKTTTVTPSHYCDEKDGAETQRSRILIPVIVLAVIGVLAVLSITLYLRRRKKAVEKEGSPRAPSTNTIEYAEINGGGLLKNSALETTVLYLENSCGTGENLPCSFRTSEASRMHGINSSDPKVPDGMCSTAVQYARAI